ncbi:MAG TPA: hypothetical protein VNV43_14620 [Candidatus Acidoferrales bacterium]|jgi:hypothetical protein|nr:hypothetical protein [Candidatus Acidoferrales bacterium]
MNLSEEQRQRVTTWISAGAKLSDVQNRLNHEFGLKLTYMETRFLVDDLKLTPKDPEPPKSEKPPIPEVKKPDEEKKSPPEAVKPGEVSVNVDQIARPGAVVSGKVTFSDGQKAEWYLDQTGRLGVIPGQQGYKPSAADVQEFQMSLQEHLQRMGL